MQNRVSNQLFRDYDEMDFILYKEEERTLRFWMLLWGCSANQCTPPWLNGEGHWKGIMLEAQLFVLALTICPSERSRGRDKCQCLPHGYPPHEKGEIHTGTHITQAVYVRLDECINNIFALSSEIWRGHTLWWVSYKFFFGRGLKGLLLGQWSARLWR